MMGLAELAISPFREFPFMANALAACVALGLGCGPVGVLLVLRRMSLVGDCLSHAVLPGAAAGFLAAGLSLPAMTVGGLAAGLTVAILAGLVTRATPLREDANFAAFYLISLAVGVLLVSLGGGGADLTHILFGSILAVDAPSLVLIAAMSSVGLMVLAVIYRPLVVECFDPGFLRAVGGQGALAHLSFLALVALNLVAGFSALGTLLSVGLMMLPAAASRFFASGVFSMSLTASLIAIASGYLGLLVSYHLDLPSGPAIILVAGLGYALAVVFGPRGGLMSRLIPRKHLEG